MLRKCVAVLFVILIPLLVHADINEDLIETVKSGQIDRVQALLETGADGPPIAQNSTFLFDYSLGHYTANEEMHKRRGEVSYIMKTIKVTDTSPR